MIKRNLEENEFMAEIIEVTNDLGDIAERLRALTETEKPEPFIADIGGILAFTETVFQETVPSRVFAQQNKPSATGSEATFDLHEASDPEQPWSAFYNLAGTSSVRATVLPPHLLECFDATFPDKANSNERARHHFAELALLANKGTADVLQGTLRSNMGLIIPHTAKGPRFVHRITSLNPEVTTSLINLVASSTREGSTRQFRDRGYVSLDSLITQALRNPARTEDTPPSSSSAQERPGARSANDGPFSKPSYQDPPG